MYYSLKRRRKESNFDPVTVYDTSRAYDGYTLFVPIGQRDAWLVDMQGRPVHHWKMSHTIRVTAELLLNGNLLCGGKTSKEILPEVCGSAGELVEVNWDGELIWRHEDPYINAHDWCRTKNGNTVISHFVPIPDDIAARVKGGIRGTEHEGAMWSDCLQEITPDGKVVWEWPAYEHMDFDVDILCPLCHRKTWTLLNSLDVLPDGNILISLRNIDTIAIVDKDTGNFKWRWGQGELAHQHRPIMLDNGNILVFDNGLHRRSPRVDLSYSRVLEIDPKIDKIEWKYMDENSASFYSSICSNAQRLPNGNTLICESTKGRIFEVTPDKEVVWEFISPFYGYYPTDYIGWTNMMYRAYRYGPEYEGLRGRQLDPNKFEWVLQEKSELETEEKEKVVKARLSKLGY